MHNAHQFHFECVLEGGFKTDDVGSGHRPASYTDGWRRVKGRFRPSHLYPAGGTEKKIEDFHSHLSESSDNYVDRADAAGLLSLFVSAFAFHSPERHVNRVMMIIMFSKSHLLNAYLFLIATFIHPFRVNLHKSNSLHPMQPIWDESFSYF